MFNFQIYKFQTVQMCERKFQILICPICSIVRFSNLQISQLSLSNLQVFKFQNINVSNPSDFQKIDSETSQNSATDLPKAANFQIIIYDLFFKDVPIFFLYRLKNLCDKYGVRGSRFGHMCLVVPEIIRKVLQSIRNH